MAGNLGEEILTHGVTTDTPNNIVLGAGTIHAGLQCTAGTWNFAESIIGATSGGNTFTVEPEITDIEVDGANVKTKGLAVKTSETATLETNLVEITGDILKKITLADEGSDSNATGYSVLTGSGAAIKPGSYITNFGFVGKRLDGKPIIIIFPSALCTSGLEWSAEAKSAGVLAATFECYADITDGVELDRLPWKIYYPTDTESSSLQADSGQQSAVAAQAASAGTSKASSK